SEADIDVSPPLRHVPGISGKSVFREPELALVVLPVVSEFVLVGCYLQVFRAWAPVVEKLPVDGAGSAAGAHQVVTTEEIVDNQALTRAGNTFDLVCLQCRSRSFQQVVVELVTPDRVLHRLLSEPQAAPVQFEPVERQEAVRILIRVELQVVYRLRGDPSGTKLGPGEF